MLHDDDDDELQPHQINRNIQKWNAEPVIRHETMHNTHHYLLIPNT